jgi:hypothetical protein
MAHKRKVRRSGRPRKPGPRTASGRLSRTYKGAACDHGSRDAERHRVELVNGSDQALAASPIGVLLANGHITPEQERAGRRYGWLRSVSFGVGRPSVAYDWIEPHDPRLRSDARQAALRQRFEDLVARLDPNQKVAIDHLLVDQRLPTWFRIAKSGRPPRPVDELERAALISGLDALAAP